MKEKPRTYLEIPFKVVYQEVGNMCSGGLSIYFRHLPRHIFLTVAFLFFLINPYILLLGVED